MIMIKMIKRLYRSLLSVWVRSTAILASGLLAKKLSYSPYSMKRALENGATFLPHVEPWAQGGGLVNVEKARPGSLLTLFNHQHTFLASYVVYFKCDKPNLKFGRHLESAILICEIVF